MSSIRCIDFNDLCRICTVSSDQKINVFSPEGRHKNLAMKIAECLLLNIDEKDRLPKVICAQCVQYVEHMFEFRNICNNSQAMLNSCLDTATTQNGGKVYIKDPISGTGKSLSVLGGNGHLPTVVPTPAATLTFQAPMTSATPTVQNTLQSTDLLTTIMQAVGGLKPGVNQQYTITVDNKSANNNAAVEYKIEAVPTNSTTSSESNAHKNEKHSALEEFIKLKPDIKITPLGKKEAPKPPQQIAQQQQTVSHIQIQQAIPDQQQQHQHQQQSALQIQLPHHIQQLQQQIQQQQLQQQIQQLTSQWQAQQQFTITAPPTSSTQQLGNSTPMTSLASEELSPSKNKKPKLNFVLTSPQTQTFGSTLPQPQIKLELQPTTATTVQQQTTQQINAAALLSNLAGPQSTANNVLSPNKCYLPITIRDENSDQQIVAHIDAKNFVFPTTYQVQMKLQRELATADGQSIMQFSPTSIPATLQLTPQAVANPTFQTATANINSQIHPFIIDKQELLPPQQQQQPQSQQPQPQPQQHQEQQYQPQQKRRITAEVTSQQIIRAVNYPQPVTNITQSNNNPVNATVATEERKLFKTPLQKQEKYKSIKRNSNVFEITPTTNFTQQIMEQVKQQQLQKQQAKQQEMTAQMESKQNASVSQPAGLTVQRVQTKGSDANTKAQTTSSIASSGSSPTKLPLLNKQNITISRITSQNSQNAQQKPQQQQQHLQKQQLQNQHQHVAQKQMSSVKFVQQQKTKILPRVSQQQFYPQQQQQLQQQQVQQQQQQQVQQQQQQQVQQQQQQVQQQQQQHIQKSLSSVTQQDPSTAAKVQAQLVTTKKDRNKKITAKLAASTTSQTAEAATISAITTTPVSTQKLRPITSPPSDARTNPGQNDNSGSTNSTVSNPHSCQTCGRGFKKKEHLTQHVKLHAGLRPFKCTEENCNKAFSRKEHLMRHCVSHTGKKMFSCDICSKPFSRKDNLNKHRRVHNSQTTELIYKCEICQKSFAVKAYYDKHKEMHIKSESKTAAANAVKQKMKLTAAQSLQKPPPPSIKTEQSTQKQQMQQRLHILQTSSTSAQTQPQQQIMHVQLQPQVVTTQDLAGNTITITQAPDPNLPTSLANFVQLGYSQFQNSAPGQIVCTIEK